MAYFHFSACFLAYLNPLAVSTPPKINLATVSTTKALRCSNNFHSHLPSAIILLTRQSSTACSHSRSSSSSSSECPGRSAGAAFPTAWSNSGGLVPPCFPDAAVTNHFYWSRDDCGGISKCYSPSFCASKSIDHSFDLCLHCCYVGRIGGSHQAFSSWRTCQPLCLGSQLDFGL